MWDSDRTYEILGVRLRVQSQDSLVGDEIARVWSNFAVPGTGARLANTFSVTTNGELALFRDCVQHITGSGPAVVLALLTEANRHLIANYRGFAAHAAVVGSAERIAAVLGESGVGKTTLAASAVLAGLSYGSDEALCVDKATETVVPYPKPLGLSPTSREMLGIETSDLYRQCDEEPVPARLLDAEELEPGRQLTDIIVPERTISSPPRFEALPPSEGVAALLRNSFNHYLDPAGSYHLTARLVTRSRIWRFTYSEPLAAGKALAERLTT